MPESMVKLNQWPPSCSGASLRDRLRDRDELNKPSPDPSRTRVRGSALVLE